MKLTRKAIREGLQAVPVESLLLGAGKAKQSALTAKQRKFAEAVAMGKSKAQAYREAYDSQGKAITQGHEGHRLSRDPKVSAQIEALKLAAEAARHATPAALRALVIERLTQHAIDEAIAPAQRLRALELLGKVTEVAAFTERREVITQRDPGAARAALLDGIRAALRAGAVDVQAIERPSSGNNVTGGRGEPVGNAALSMSGDVESSRVPHPPGCANAADEAGPDAAPRAQARAHAHALLSIPHTQSPENSDPRLPNFSDDQSNNVTETPPHGS